MNTNDLDQSLRDSLSGTAPADIHATAQRHFDALAPKMNRQVSQPTQRAQRPLWLWPGLGFAGAAAAVMLAFTFFMPALSWAQVVEKFRSLRFFNITLYVTSNASEPPEKLEIWASQDHRNRVHYRGLMIFGREGKVVKVLRADTGEELAVDALKAATRDPDKRKAMPIADMALGIPQALAKTPHFSLDELMTYFGGNREALKPVANLDASIAPDMQVFDFTAPGFPDWFRLWVLKKSELPVRIRSWNPNRGDQVEAVFDYFTQMPDEAFDPDKVKAAITSKAGAANRLYALLKDPGKRPLTPEDYSATVGQHLPQSESVGRTEEGVVWVLSKHSWNEMSDGRTRYGWGIIADDLGQKYLPSSFVGSTTEGQRSLEYFIPLGYRTDYRKPQSYTLTCSDQNEYRPQGKAPTIVGSVEVKQWKENAPMPKLFNDLPALDDSQFMLAMLRHVFSRKDWDRFDKLIATIPGRAENNKLARFRDVLLASKLDLIRQPEQAAALRAGLYPLVKTITKDKAWEEFHLIADYIGDRVRAGKKDDARAVANETVSALTREKSQHHHIVRILYTLHRTGMTEAEVRQFFDEDVFNLPHVKEEMQRRNFFMDGVSSSLVKPQFSAWREFTAKLAKRYEGQPLPTEFEFIDEQPALPADQTFTPLPLLGHGGYRVTFLPANQSAESLMYQTAGALHLDSSQVISPKQAAEKLRAVVCVYRDNADWSKIWPAYLHRCGIETLEKTAPRKVLVARYDGRKLPLPADVTPIDGEPLGLKLVNSQNFAGLELNHIFDSYAQSIDFGVDHHDPHHVFILDETGLSKTPRANQTHPDSCLTEQSAFWSGPGADKLTRDWFQENFGITFNEEERPMKVLELRVAP